MLSGVLSAAGYRRPAESRDDFECLQYVIWLTRTWEYTLGYNHYVDRTGNEPSLRYIEIVRRYVHLVSVPSEPLARSGRIAEIMNPADLDSVRSLGFIRELGLPL